MLDSAHQVWDTLNLVDNQELAVPDERRRIGISRLPSDGFIEVYVTDLPIQA